MAKHIVGQKTKMMRLILSFFFPCFFFSISHSNIIHEEICVKDFSGTTMARILTSGTNAGYDLCFVKEKQPSDAYHPLYFSILLSLQSNFLLQISQLL